MAQAIGLISLFSGRAVAPDVAMTGRYQDDELRALQARNLISLSLSGELSLRGRVLPVGGIKEKLIGACEYQHPCCGVLLLWPSYFVHTHVGPHMLIL